MFFITIDTCNLEKLINDASDDWALDPLHQFVSSEQLRFIAPPTLKREWEEHKQKKTRTIQKRQRIHRKEREESESLGIFDAEKDLSDGEKRVLRQIEKLDTIVYSSPEIEKYNNVVLMIDNLRDLKQSPFFHTTVKQNDKDAKIIFGCLEYAKLNGINELVFVSDNIKEFASKDQEGQLHLNIHKQYPDVTVHLFQSPLKAVEFLKQKGLVVKAPSASHDRLVKPAINVDHSLPILDQLHGYLSVRLKDWAFLPKMFLVNQYPFVTGKFALDCTEVNAFTTNNDLLFELLKSLSVCEGQYACTFDLTNVNCSQQKITEVMNWFRTCGIHKVKHVKGGEFFLPFIPNEPTCTCYACKWNNQEFTSMRRDLSTEHLGLEDKIDQAYAAYELSEYASSINILLKVVEQAKDEKNYVRLFIAQYNIILLKRQHDFTKFGDTFPDPLEGVDSFDIDEAIHLMDRADQEVAQWLNNGSIYENSASALLRDNQKFRKSLRRSNRLPTNDYNEYFEKFNWVWRFLTVNRIVGDQLSEFTKVYKAFQEGIFLILALDRGKSKDKIGLYVQHLLLLVRYGSYRDIEELIAEYRIINIPFVDTGDKDFVNCLLRLIEEMASYPSSELFNQGPYYFHEQLNRMLDVYAILCQNIGISLPQSEMIAKKLLEYSRKPDLRNNSRHFSPITHFLTWQSSVIDKGVILEFVFQYIQKDRILDFKSAEMLVRSLEDRNTKFTLAPESSKTFHVLVFHALVKDDPDKLSQLLRMAAMSSDENDVCSINIILTEVLSKKFLPQCYGVARTFDYLRDHFQLFDTYLQYMENYVKELVPRKRDDFHDVYGTDVTVDQFLNIHFKERFPLSETMKETLKSRSAYYLWLFDLEGYNYLDFQVDWVWHAFTIYFKRHLRTSHALKNKLLQIYTETKRKDIGDLLIHLYVRQDA